MCVVDVVAVSVLVIGIIIIVVGGVNVVAVVLLWPLLWCLSAWLLLVRFWLLSLLRFGCWCRRCCDGVC